MWQRSFVAVSTLLGETDAEACVSLDAESRALQQELRHGDRSLRARALAREISNVLVDLAALVPEAPRAGR